MNTMTTSTPLRGLIASAIFGALASGFVSLSSAADSAQVPEATVKYGDLNVSTSQGAAALYSRIHAAAERVCSNLDRSDPFSRMQRDTCVNQSVADGVRKVNQAALFAVYNTKNARPLPMIVATEQPR